MTIPETEAKTEEQLEIEAFDRLYDDSTEYFRYILSELRNYGIEPDPNLELRRSPSMQSYYNLTDGHIYLAVPDLKTSPGRMFKLFMKSLLSIEDDATYREFMRMLMPRLLAHELGHHLRHRYKQFRRENMWQEDQVANQLAMSVIKRRLTPEQKERIRTQLSSTIEILSQKMESKSIAIDSYRNLVQALHTTQQLDDEAFDTIELVRSVFSIDTEELLRASGELPEQVLERIEKHEEIIEEINQQYTSDAVRYLYYHLGWLYCDLFSQQSDYVDEFATNYLGLKPDLLPELEMSAITERLEIRALYRAYLELKDRSNFGRRYFYKRYRSSLLKRLEASHLVISGGKIETDLTNLLEM